MAHESCKSQIAVLEMNGQSVPQRWTSMREGSNTARRQCSAWNVELSAIRRAKILASYIASLLITGGRFPQILDLFRAFLKIGVSSQWLYRGNLDF